MSPPARVFPIKRMTGTGVFARLGWMRGLCAKNDEFWCACPGDSELGALPETCGHARRRK